MYLCIPRSFWIQLPCHFPVYLHIVGLYIYKHVLLSRSPPPTHIGFLSLSGFSPLQAFCVQMCPVMINKLCSHHKGSDWGRKHKGCTTYLHWQQPSKHRYIKTRPEEQWLCHQEQGAYGTQCFIVGLSPLEGYNHWNLVRPFHYRCRSRSHIQICLSWLFYQSESL